MQSKVKTLVLAFWLPVVFPLAAIFCFSSLPGTAIPCLFPAQEVVFHFSIYLILGFLFARALENTVSDAISGRKIVFITVAFGFIYAITDELRQLFVPYRSYSGWDMLIDVLGVFAGSLLYSRIKTIRTAK